MQKANEEPILNDTKSALLLTVLRKLGNIKAIDYYIVLIVIESCL